MADLVAGFFGSRGQGKSTQARHLLWKLAPPRLVVLDPMDEYGEHAERVGSLKELGKRTQAATFRLRYVPPRDEPKPTLARFDALCALAIERANLLLLVEELQLFTRPSYAPPAWSEVTLRGRHRRVRVVGLSQRPASVDKNFFSCCTIVSTGRLNYRSDQVCMADVIGATVAEVRALPRYHFIARDMQDGRTVRGDTGELLAQMGRPPGRRLKAPAAGGAGAKPALVTK